MDTLVDLIFLIADLITGLIDRTRRKPRLDHARELIHVHRYEDALTLLDQIDDPEARLWEKRIQAMITGEHQTHP